MTSDTGASVTNLQTALLEIRNRIDEGCRILSSSNKMGNKSIQMIAHAILLLVERELLYKNGAYSIDNEGLKECGAKVLNRPTVLDDEHVKSIRKWLVDAFIEPRLTKKTALDKGITINDSRLYNLACQSNAKALLDGFNCAAVLSFLGIKSIDYVNSSHFAIRSDLFIPFGTIVDYSPNHFLVLTNVEGRNNYLLFENPLDNKKRPILLRPSVLSIVKFLTVKDNADGDKPINLPVLLENVIDNLHPDLPIPNTELVNTMLMELFARCEHWINIRKRNNNEKTY